MDPVACSSSCPSPFVAPPMPMPPGGPIEIAFSFDTTGSMSECLEQVRGQLADVIQRLTADIPGLRVAVFAHGDYCDAEMYGYVTKHVDFTNDVNELCRFVNDVGGTGGGDFEECYELVLRQVREQLSWQPGTQRALVMIGDATPHEVTSEQNADRIDWRHETHRLITENGTHIYAVQCLNNPEADDFYRHIADATGGKHLKLDELTNIVDIMMAICYREKGVEYFEAFENEVRHREGSAMRADIDRMFVMLKDVPNAGPSCSTASDVADDVTRTMDDAESDAGSSGVSFTPPFTPPHVTTRPRAGSVSSRGSVTSSRSTASSRSSASRRRSSGVMTRSRAHPMTLRRRRGMDEIRRTNERRRKPKQTPSQRCLEKALRERQRDADLPFSDLSWSRWQQAMTPAATPPNGTWQQRPGMRVGDRKRRLFPDTATPAVYEVAVQAPGAQTKTPVLGAVTASFRGRHWEAALLSRPHVRHSVDDVLRKGCKLYVRRAPVEPEDEAGSGAVREMRRLMRRSCDYAWTPRTDADQGKRVHRTLVRKGVRISGEERL